jgi:hypothetical protein
LKTAPAVAWVPRNPSERPEDAELNDQPAVVIPGLVVEAVVNVNVAWLYVVEVPEAVAIFSGVALVSPYAFKVNVLPKHALETFENATVEKLNPPPFAALAKVAVGVDVIASSQAVVSATP